MTALMRQLRRLPEPKFYHLLVLGYALAVVAGILVLSGVLPRIAALVLLGSLYAAMVVFMLCKRFIWQPQPQ